MGLRTKFNLGFLIVSLPALGLAGYFIHSVLQNNAREEVLQSARPGGFGADVDSGFPRRQIIPVNHDCHVWRCCRAVSFFERHAALEDGDMAYLPPLKTIYRSLIQSRFESRLRTSSSLIPDKEMPNFL
jgi:hypothetical protein